MAGISSQRRFSEHKHQRGEWNTTAAGVSNPVLRALGGFLSYKRRLIDHLARSVGPTRLILDAGAGTGAYAHWFLGRQPVRIVAVDWAMDGLRRIQGPRQGAILRVCADVCRLPFKQEVFDAVYSVDTLGHVQEPEACLDEMLRTALPGAALAVHSECSDYRRHWPDRALIRKVKRDIPAELDGHISLRTSRELRHAYVQRFRLRSFFSPAGYLGWLIGYPEKYNPAFKAAGARLWSAATKLCAILKKVPLVGLAMRCVNALSNHAELFLGLEGGGSCFGLLSKPPVSEDRASLPKHPSPNAGGDDTKSAH